MYIITGGAGFIGSAFAAKLNSLGIDDIYIVDDLGSSNKWKNLSSLKFADYFHKKDFLQSVMEDTFPLPIKAIVHLGACSDTTEQDANYLMENNYRYTRILADYALRKRIRFIYASSGATYGDGALGFSDSEQSTQQLKPLNMYGYSKQLFDLHALRSCLFDKIVGLKFFNVFGPNEYHKGEMRSVVIKSFEQIRDTGRVSLFKSYQEDYSDGEQKRDFLYVSDCCDLMWWFIENPKKNGLFNVGSGEARTWNDLAKAVFAAMGKTSCIDYIEMPDELKGRYQYFTQAEMSKLKNSGFDSPFTSLEAGVEDYVKNYLLPAEHLSADSFART